MNPTEKIISKANIKTEDIKLNILTFQTHERYEEQLCKTGHNFYAFNLDGMKQWNTKYAPMPENYVLMPESQIFDHVNFDLILSQDRFYQFKTASQIRNQLLIPIVALEHTMLGPHASDASIQYMKSCVGDINIFISDFSRKYVGIEQNSGIIHHGVNTDKFCNMKQDRQKRVLSVANDFINREYCLNFTGWQRITENFDVTVRGDTPGLSEAANPEELVELYNTHLVFLNTTTHSPIPTVVLEAMSCGCAVVSTATCMIPEIIENGKNGFISNDEQELKDRIQYLFDNPEEAKKMGENARQTILEKFNLDRFVKDWNKVFYKCIGRNV